MRRANSQSLTNKNSSTFSHSPPLEGKILGHLYRNFVLKILKCWMASTNLLEIKLYDSRKPKRRLSSFSFGKLGKNRKLGLTNLGKSTTLSINPWIQHTWQKFSAKNPSWELSSKCWKTLTRILTPSTWKDSIASMITCLTVTWKTI